ncbi:hypothetical protein L1049_020646 [Liquidambar formosana]|uniref:DUF4283 domain-containing protein n=1 Tax=Liquidambar formosana TaxID=63359 RepID=A0AAP0S7H1_LIQFO
MLLICESELDKRHWLENDSELLSNWFLKLKEWDPQVVNKTRLVWVSVLGMPLHVWNIKNFRKIGEVFGEVVSWDSNIARKSRFDSARILLSMDYKYNIDGKISVLIKEKNFKVSVREEKMLDFHDIKIEGNERKHCHNPNVEEVDSVDSGDCGLYGDESLKSGELWGCLGSREVVQRA